MNNESKMLCREINALLCVIGVLVFVAVLYLVFGWGKSGTIHWTQIGQPIEATRPLEREFEVPAQQQGQPMRVAFGFPTKSSIGASVVNLDVVTQQIMGFKNTDGALVQAVEPGSAAAAAGLQARDLVINIDGHRIENVADFDEQIADFVPGSRYKFWIIRNNKQQSLNLIYTSSFKQVALANNGQLPWLGADVQDIDKFIQKHFNLPNTKGAMISFVEPNSPSAMAGLKAGDVFRDFDGTKIKTPTDLQEAVLTKKAGDKVRVTMLRGAETFNTDITLTTKPLVAEPIPTLPGPEVEVEAAWLGLDIVPMTPAEAEELGLPEGTAGMVVDGIQKGLASKSGVKVGDVIIEVNRKPVTSLETFQNATENMPDVMLTMLRGGKTLYITIGAPPFVDPKDKAAFVQVASATYKKVLVSAAGRTLFDQIGPDFASARYFIVYDPNTGTYEAIDNPGFGTATPGVVVLQFLIGRGVGSVITGRIDGGLVAQLAAENINVYTGVFGTVSTAVRMYKDNKLVAAAP